MELDFQQILDSSSAQQTTVNNQAQSQQRKTGQITISQATNQVTVSKVMQEICLNQRENSFHSKK